MTDRKAVPPISAPPARIVTGVRRPASDTHFVDEQYREMVDRAPIGVYQSTPDGRLLTANLALARLLGYETVGELLEVNLADIYVNPRERELLIVAFERVGTSAELELQWKR